MPPVRSCLRLLLVLSVVAINWSPPATAAAFDGVAESIPAARSVRAHLGTCDKTWDGPATGGTWQTDANWSPDGVPTAGQIVCIGSGNAVILSSGDHTIGLLHVESGASLTISGGSLAIASDSHIDGAFTLSGGTLAGTGALTITGLFTWSGGALSGDGAGANEPAVAAGGIELSGGNKTLSGRTLVHASPSAPAVMSGAGALSLGGGAELRVEAGATFDLRNDQGFFATTGGSVTNAGTFRRSAGAGVAHVSGLPFANSGLVDVQAGTLAFSGGYTQTAGVTRLSGGDINSSTALQIHGGVLEGEGTITGDVSVGGPGSGHVSPGLSGPAILAITGNYLQTASGTYDADVGGLTPGTQLDQIQVSGSATIEVGAIVDVDLIGGFEPSDTDSFPILTAASIQSDFSAVTGDDPGRERSWDTLPGQNVLSLIIAGAPTATGTPTATATETGTATATATSTETPTQSPTPTATATPTETSTPTPSSTATSTSTPTFTPTSTSSPAPTGTPSPTSTATPTGTSLIPTATPTATASPTATPTAGGPTCFGLPATIVGRPGSKRITRIKGTKGNDVIVGTDGPDLILGIGGDDVVCGGGGDDYIKGSRGRDRTDGGEGDDRIDGNGGGDLLRGGPGNDLIIGGFRDDEIAGEEGDDILDGAGSNDRVDGGPGSDTCVTDTSEGADILTSCEQVRKDRSRSRPGRKVAHPAAPPAPLPDLPLLPTLFALVAAPLLPRARS